MNRKILLLLLLTTLAYSSKTEKPSPEKQLEGWAGNPDNPNEKPFDYFYMRSVGRARDYCVSKKNAETMKTTCIDAVSTNLKRKFIEFMLRDSSYQFCKSIQEKGSIYYSQQEFTYYANPDNDIHLINATDWPCISRESIIKKFNERKTLNLKVKECKPLYPDDPKIPNSEWRECECIVYAYIPGGRDAIVAIAQQIEIE